MHSSHKDQSSKTPGDNSGNEPMQLPGSGISPNDPTEADVFDQWAFEAASNQHSPVQSANGKPRSRMGRRKLVAVLAAGTAGVITVVTVGGISFARSPQWGGSSSHGATSPIALREQGDGEGKGESEGTGDDDGKRPHKKPTPTGSPRATQPPSPTKTPAPQPSATTQPTMTPTMKPTPTGTTIGSSTQAVNTAVAFTNPADGQASWLVHMSNGNFVAVEGACTHAGVPVKYNTSLGQFTCPAHGAIFNADGTNPQAPATKPLPPVHITVNANGTITTP